MNHIDRELQAIVGDEIERVNPPEGAKERGWARLQAAASGAGGGSGDASPPLASAAMKPAPALKVVPWLKALPLVALLGVGSLGLLAIGAGEPAIVADTIQTPYEPVLPVLSPIHIPLGPNASAVAVIDAPPDAPQVPALPVGPRRTAPRPTPGTDEDNFADELRLLSSGQAAIQRGELREGLALLRSHKQRYPSGSFAQERDALIAIGRCEAGQAGARVAGQKFLHTNPDSIHAERVRNACEP